MKLICLQHAWFDDAGHFEEWTKDWNVPLEYSDAKKPEEYPELDDGDVLIILGGPMSVKDRVHKPWMQKELDYIKKAIENKHKIIGICLGSQLIAHLYGCAIYTLDKPEMGWGSLDWSEDFLVDFNVEKLTGPMFHWHSDLYYLPKGMKQMGGTPLTPVQGFYNDQILAFQFHPEITFNGIQRFLDHDDQNVHKRDTGVGIAAPKPEAAYVKQSHTHFQPILEKFLALKGKKN